jgi:hypothetical protein
VRGRRRANRSAMRAFSLGVSVKEEGEGKGDKKEDEDYDGSYYAAVKAGGGVCC